MKLKTLYGSVNGSLRAVFREYAEKSGGAHPIQRAYKLVNSRLRRLCRLRSK